jgi:lipid II:glycine glycyltransferase (peptidoglycan interpeptide bridge formation enzyme)
MATFDSEGYRLREDLDAGRRTLLVDLRPSLQEIRSGLDRKWRNQLTRAEKNNLEVIEGNGDSAWTMFTNVYREMLERKRFVDVDIDEFWAIQSSLPEAFKMKVMICKAEGKVGAGVVCSALGNTGIYMFGATNRLGMETKASYLLQWHVIKWLKEAGIHIYNLHGINPEKNPGTYHFKSGLCGKNGTDVSFIGRFDASQNQLSRLTVHLGESVRTALLQMKARFSLPSRSSRTEA